MLIFYGGHIVQLKMASRPVCLEIDASVAFAIDAAVTLLAKGFFDKRELLTNFSESLTALYVLTKPIQNMFTLT